MARAVALNREVLVLDDVLSALDPSTKSRIANRLLGPKGLARSHQMTVLSMTHDSKHTRVSGSMEYVLTILVLWWSREPACLR